MDAAATLTATFSGGVTTVWPAQRPIRQTQCSRGGASLRRHRIAALSAARLGHLPDHDITPLSRALAQLRDWQAQFWRTSA